MLFIYTQFDELINVENLTGFFIKDEFNSHNIVAVMLNGDDFSIARYDTKSDAKDALVNLSTDICNCPCGGTIFL